MTLISANLSSVTAITEFLISSSMSRQVALVVAVTNLLSLILTPGEGYIMCQTRPEPEILLYIRLCHQYNWSSGDLCWS